MEHVPILNSSNQSPDTMNYLFKENLKKKKNIINIYTDYLHLI